MAGNNCACGRVRAPGASDDIRVLVVDDHAMVRRTLSEVLDDEDGLTVVGECEDGTQVVEAVERLHPDVVVMDLAMPVMNGLAATEALRAAHLESRVVVLTAEASTARPAVAAAGANALLTKTARADALLRCVRTVVIGCGCCPHCL